MAAQEEFDPIISRITLNPEQAVLACTCVLGRYVRTASTRYVASLCRTRASGTSRNSRAASYCKSATTADFT